MSAVLRRLGLSRSPGNWKNVRTHIVRLGIETSHITGQAHGTSKRKDSKTLEERLVVGDNTGSAALRKLLLKTGLLANICAERGRGPRWNDKPITLQLDHINGDSSDNRLCNLRILCPNCHSQTTTFTGKNSARYSAPARHCIACDRQIFRSSKRCTACHGAAREQTTHWPPPLDVAAEVQHGSYRATANRLGVSDNAVRKFLRRHLGSAPQKHRVKP